MQRSLEDLLNRNDKRRLGGGIEQPENKKNNVSGNKPSAKPTPKSRLSSFFQKSGPKAAPKTATATPRGSPTQKSMPLPFTIRPGVVRPSVHHHQPRTTSHAAVAPPLETLSRHLGTSPTRLSSRPTAPRPQKTAIDGDDAMMFATINSLGPGATARMRQEEAKRKAERDAADRMKAEAEQRRKAAAEDRRQEQLRQAAAAPWVVRKPSPVRDTMWPQNTATAFFYGDDYKKWGNENKRREEEHFKRMRQGGYGSRDSRDFSDDDADIGNSGAASGGDGEEEGDPWMSGAYRGSVEENYGRHPSDRFRASAAAEEEDDPYYSSTDEEDWDEDDGDENQQHKGGGGGTAESSKTISAGLALVSAKAAGARALAMAGKIAVGREAERILVEEMVAALAQAAEYSRNDLAVFAVALAVETEGIDRGSARKALLMRYHPDKWATARKQEQELAHHVTQIVNKMHDDKAA